MFTLCTFAANGAALRMDTEQIFAQPQVSPGPSATPFARYGGWIAGGVPTAHLTVLAGFGQAPRARCRARTYDESLANRARLAGPEVDWVQKQKASQNARGFVKRGMRAWESAKADFGPLLQRIHPPPPPAA